MPCAHCGRYVFTTEAHILPLDLHNLTGDQEAAGREAAEVAEALRQLGAEEDEEDAADEADEGGVEGQEAAGRGTAAQDGDDDEEEEGPREEGAAPANATSAAVAAAAAGGGAPGRRRALQGSCATPSYRHMLGFYGNAPHGSNSQVLGETRMRCTCDAHAMRMRCTV